MDVPENLPGIIFISASTSFLAQGITNMKGPKGAGDARPSLGDLITSGGIVAPERFKFLVWTVLGGLAFVDLVFLEAPDVIQTLLKVPGGFLQLMGAS